MKCSNERCKSHTWARPMMDLINGMAGSGSVSCVRPSPPAQIIEGTEGVVKPLA